jgi:hypothetical protein
VAWQNAHSAYSDHVLHRRSSLVPHCLGHSAHAVRVTSHSLLFIPESPGWLAKVDRNDEAIAVLANIQAGGDQTRPSS